MYQQLIKNFWGEQACHLPNVTDVFGYQEISNLMGYTSRILGALPKQHFLILPQSCKSQVVEMLAYYNHIGFPCINDRHVDFLSDEDFISLSSRNKRKQLKDLFLNKFGATNLIPYIHSQSFKKILSYLKINELSDPVIIRKINNKCTFRKILQRKCIETPLSYCVNLSKIEATKKCLTILDELKKQGYKEFVISLPESYGGIGTLKFNNKAGLLNILKKVDKGEILIGPWYNDIIAHPSFQIFLANKKEDDIFLGVTDQIVTGTHHIGNVYPSNFSKHPKVKQVIENTIELLRENGVRGPVGVDMFIRKENDIVSVYVNEANVRQTAAFYPEMIMMKLFENKQKTWIYQRYTTFKNFTLKKFDHLLVQKGIGYKYGCEEGVLVTNYSQSTNECAVIVIADTLERAKKLKMKLDEIKEFK